jgi:hypothetical protein
MPKQKKISSTLSGWEQIADLLGQPISVAERWAKSGIPATYVGRHVRASREELTNGWDGSLLANLCRSPLRLKIRPPN